MNIIITFCVVLFVMCFGAEYVVSSGTEEIEVCRTRFDMNYYQVWMLGTYCSKKAISDTERLKYQNASTIEDYQGLATTLCQKQTLVRTCLAETATKIEVSCQNEEFLKTFQIYRDMYENVLDIGCSENDVKLATLLHGMEHIVMSEDEISSARKCWNRFYQLIIGFHKLNIDISSKFFNIYKELKILAECFHQADSLADSLKEVFRLFFGGMIKTMKCVHPQDGTMVPCGTIDASSIALPTMCDMYLKDNEPADGTNMSMYDNLGNAVTSRLLELLLSFTYPDEKVRDNYSVKSLIDRVCHGLWDRGNGSPFVRFLSETCLNDTEQHELNLLKDFVYNAFSTACAESDERSIVILTEVLRNKNYGENNALSRCISVLMSDSKRTDAHRSPSKNMRIYHVVEAYKECLVNKLQGDQPSIDAVTSLINDMLMKLKCVHPVEGTEVPCETLRPANVVVA